MQIRSLRERHLFFFANVHKHSIFKKAFRLETVSMPHFFYNTYGQLIKQMNQLFGKTIILQRDNLPSGVYFIQLSQDNKLISTEKMVITD